MDEEAAVKNLQNCSSHETDSFDEPKGVPISLEPVFSTATGVRIDVKLESIDKSKKLLNPEPNKFSSPIIKTRNNGSTPFVSPFRKDESTSSKRHATDQVQDFSAPPAKKAFIVPQVARNSSSSSSRTERKEIHADVLRVGRIHEKEQIRLVLQESKSAPLILATCSYRRGYDIKFGDRIHVDVQIERKDEKDMVTAVYIEKVIKNRKNGAGSGIRKHSIAEKPFCIKPRFIHELADQAIKKTVVQVNLLDLKFEIYDGCSECKRLTDRKRCSHCRSSKAKVQTQIYSRMRVSDFSGQIFVNVSTKTMEKFLEMLGYKGIERWIEFKDPNERHNYVFRPLMIEIEKNGKEWECTDVADVNWDNYASYLVNKVASK